MIDVNIIGTSKCIWIGTKGVSGLEREGRLWRAEKAFNSAFIKNFHIWKWNWAMGKTDTRKWSLLAFFVPHHKHAEAPPVCGVRMSLPVNHLGRHVLHRAAEGVRLLLEVLLGQAKVGHRNVTIVIEEQAEKNIARLYFKVNIIWSYHQAML